MRIGVIGVGSIGMHHTRIFSELKGVELVGVVDTNAERAQGIASKYRCRTYDNHLKIMDLIDAVSIAVPTTMHYSIAMDFLRNNKDIFIEKPITSTLNEAEELISEAARREQILQVGHLERFNAGLSIITDMVKNPQLIESHRLSPFHRRGTDVDVTLDLMTHDIDIILSLVKSDISDLRATGAKVLTDNIDIAYAWLEFKNGCIAEIAASRVSPEKVRQLKIYQHNTHFSLDYQSQEVSCYRKVNSRIEKEVKKPEKKEPLKEELAAFLECIRNRTRPVVSGFEGKEALRVALKISEMVNDGNIRKNREHKLTSE